MAKRGRPRKAVETEIIKESQWKNWRDQVESIVQEYRERDASEFTDRIQEVIDEINDEVQKLENVQNELETLKDDMDSGDADPSTPDWSEFENASAY